MGIHCEIMMSKSKNSYIPGEAITGTIRYAVDKDTNLKQITISLKGLGRVEIRKDKKTHWEDEMYVDMDDFHLKEETIVRVGCYEIPFNFIVPKNIPPSINYSTYTTEFNDEVHCQIFYYVRIKFEMSGVFSFAKRFKKTIYVLPQIIPKQPTTPTVHETERNITKLFSSGENKVNIKSTIQSCIIKPESQFNLKLEIENNTHVKIKWIEIKLRQKYCFYATGIFHPIRKYKIVYETKMGQIKSGETKIFEIDIDNPPGAATLEHARIVERDYALIVTAGLPIPHFNISYKIPVQIGYYAVEGEGNIVDAAFHEETDNPPSYWDVMVEDDEKA